MKKDEIRTTIRINWGPALWFIFLYFVIFGWALVPWLNGVVTWLNGVVIGCILAANAHTERIGPPKGEIYVSSDAEEMEMLRRGETACNKKENISSVIRLSKENPDSLKLPIIMS